MPPVSTVLPQKRKLPTNFKPPRPIGSSKAVPKVSSTSETARRTTTAASQIPPRRSAAKDDPDLMKSSNEEMPAFASSLSDDTMPSLAVPRGNIDGAGSYSDDDLVKGTQPPPVIPPALLTRLFHHFFENKSQTRMEANARLVAGKYIETFVREAIARAALERSNAVSEGGMAGVVGAGDFLEVEDLERLAPQLLLDF